MAERLRHAVDLAVEPREEPALRRRVVLQQRRAHIAGVSVSAMKPETDTEITIVIANCL